MANFKQIKIEYYSERTKNPDKQIAMSFTTSGKGSYTDVKWLTISEALLIKDKLNEILTNLNQI